MNYKIANDTIFCTKVKRISSMADAKAFVKDIKGCMYFQDVNNFQDFCISRQKDEYILSSRMACHRGDVFAPYSEEIQTGKSRPEVAERFVWVNRKSVNRYLKGEQ